MFRVGFKMSPIKLFYVNPEVAPPSLFKGYGYRCSCWSLEALGKKKVLHWDHHSAPTSWCALHDTNANSTKSSGDSWPSGPSGSHRPSINGQSDWQYTLEVVSGISTGSLTAPPIILALMEFSLSKSCVFNIIWKSSKNNILVTTDKQVFGTENNTYHQLLRDILHLRVSKLVYLANYSYYYEYTG